MGTAARPQAPAVSHRQNRLLRWDRTWRRQARDTPVAPPQGALQPEPTRGLGASRAGDGSPGNHQLTFAQGNRGVVSRMHISSRCLLRVGKGKVPGTSGLSASARSRGRDGASPPAALPGHTEDRADVEQPVWIYQAQIVPSQLNGFL